MRPSVGRATRALLRKNLNCRSQPTPRLSVSALLVQRREFAQKKSSGSWKRLVDWKDVRDKARRHGAECLSGGYANIRTPLEWKCAKGKTWTARMHAGFNKMRYCSTCGVEARAWNQTLDDAKD